MSNHDSVPKVLIKETYLLIIVNICFYLFHNFFVEAGPYLGLGIGKAKAESCVDGGNCETEETEYGSDEEQIKNPDFGAQFGAGVNINKNISVDVRYVLGLSNLVNNATDDESWKNNAINIGVGYKF